MSATSASSPGLSGLLHYPDCSIRTALSGLLYPDRVLEHTFESTPLSNDGRWTRKTRSQRTRAIGGPVPRAASAPERSTRRVFGQAATTSRHGIAGPTPAHVVPTPTRATDAPTPWWARLYARARAGVAELADAEDLNSSGPRGPCGFEPHHPHDSTARPATGPSRRPDRVQRPTTTSRQRRVVVSPRPPPDRGSQRPWPSGRRSGVPGDRVRTATDTSRSRRHVARRPTGSRGRRRRGRRRRRG
jgi:hypothetical protein